jgi:hypothetical protein
MLAGLLALLAFCIYHDLHGGLVTFHFDNDAGLDKVPREIPKCLQSTSIWT